MAIACIISTLKKKQNEKNAPCNTIQCLFGQTDCNQTQPFENTLTSLSMILQSLTQASHLPYTPSKHNTKQNKQTKQTEQTINKPGCFENKAIIQQIPNKINDNICLYS